MASSVLPDWDRYTNDNMRYQAGARRKTMKGKGRGKRILILRVSCYETSYNKTKGRAYVYIVVRWLVE